MQRIDDEELLQLLPRLRRFALGLTRDTHAAEDLTQSCLERALSQWGSKRVSGDLQAWLCSIMYRQFLDENGFIVVRARGTRILRGR